MLVKGIIAGQMSGSLDGYTASHNAGGQYFRQRSIPTNPGTSGQEAIRNYLADLANRWHGVLSGAQRTSWEVYNANVLMLNRIGDAIHIGALAHYIRSNVPRLQAGLSRVDVGPAVYNLGEYEHPSFAATAPTTLSVTFNTGDAWVSEDNAAMIVWASRPQGQSINYFKGPYQYCGAILGSSGSPPTSPQALTLPFAVNAGHKVFLRVNVVRGDARLGATFRSGDIAA